MSNEHKVVKSILFIIWLMAIAALSVVPYSNNVAISFKLTGSGMVVHFIAYFVGTALFFWIFRKDPQITQISRIQGNRNEELGISKKEIGPQITQITRIRDEIKNVRR